jgi:hypothetical protein
MKRSLKLLICSLVSVLVGGPAAAQVDTSGQVRFSVTPYGWALSLHGRVGVGPVAANADVSFRDLLKTLRFGIMANGEVSKGRWFGTMDVIYASLGKENTVAFRGDTGTLELSGKMSIIQTVGGYSVGNNKWAVDFYGGFRAWDMRTTLDVDVTKRPSNPHSLARGWPDALAGARFRAEPYRRFHVIIGGDGGAGGSHSTWQGYATVGYDVCSKVAVGAAYRYLSVNYEDNLFLYDVRLRGPVLGATIHW